jgi:hypothetical protein
MIPSISGPIICEISQIMPVFVNVTDIGTSSTEVVYVDPRLFMRPVASVPEGGLTLDRRGPQLI